MPEFTRSLFSQSLDDWGRYVEVFRQMPGSEQSSFLKDQGFASLRDLLAHVAAWWEEAGIRILETLDRRELPPRKYNLDEFNAAALSRFKDTPEAEMIAWYEVQRQHMISLVGSLTDEQLQVSRVSGWLDGVILEHLKVHGPAAPRFLIIDTLQREWGGCVERFNALPPEKQAAFLKQQGFERFRDLVAHVLAWWEEGIRVIQTSSDEDPCVAQDVDVFNAEAVKKYAALPESEVLADFEQTRLTLINLVDTLPEEVLGKPNVRDWLRADVIEHYFEHAM
jgi:hypothetical protein